MKILLVAAEVSPFAKTGGLADVAGSLPKALRALGHDIRIILPAYQEINPKVQKFVPIGKTVKVKIGQLQHLGEILEGQSGDVPVYLIKCDELFDRPGIYGPPEGGGFPDNLQRFAFFCGAVLEAIKTIPFPVEVIHCNDWHTALIPGLLKTLYAQDPFFQSIRTLYTVHNLGYQGTFPLNDFESLGLDPWPSIAEAYEYYGEVNFMKGGVILADLINTVSPNYAKEIQTPEHGCGLDKILNLRRDQLFGILNGIDYQDWNPIIDPNLISPFSINSIDRKTKNKQALQRELGLEESSDIPLVGMVARLAEQKGCDLLGEALPCLLQDTNMQFVVLGTGEKRYEELIKQLIYKYPRQVAAEFNFNDPLAHRIYAGADIFLIPSQYEPSGLSQMISFRYGTIPVARATGGLVDTVIDYSSSEKGNGFLFHEYSGEALAGAIRRALEVFVQPAKWKQLINRGMKLDFSWKNSALEYLALYYKIIVG